MDYNAKFDSVHQGQVAFGRLSTKPANYTNYQIKMKKGLSPTYRVLYQSISIRTDKY